MTIHIGAMMPNRSLDESVLIKAITKVATDLAVLRDHLVQQKTLSWTLYFYYPVGKKKLTLQGYGCTHLTLRQILRIESAVPEKMVTSIHAERFVIAIIQDAIDAAGEFFSEQHVLFDLSAHLALVDLVTTKEQRAIN